MKNKLKNNKGFTLVEMLVAVSLFVVVTTVSAGAIISILDVNKKAQSSKTVVDNLNLSIENMARIIRFGDHYYCGISSGQTSTLDCPVGGSGSVSVTFYDKNIPENIRVVYRLNGTTIQRSDNGGSTYTDITAPEAKIDYLRFYVRNSQVSGQPSVTAVVRGYVGSKEATKSTFSIEALMSQRTLDI